LRQNNIKSAIAVIFALIGVSCGSDPIRQDLDNAVDTFPLEIGNRWEYRRIYYEVPLHDSAYADTVESRFIRRVIGIDTSGQLAGLYMVDDSLTTYWPGEDPDTDMERYWRGINDNKLYEYASASPDQNGLFNPVIYQTPQPLLDFPLTPGKQWLVASGPFGTMTRNVIDTQTLRYGDEDLFCASVRTSISFSPKFELVEWYSNRGLIQALSKLGTREVYDEYGVVIDSISSYWVMNLSAMSKGGN
jgi:hypothetical protein